MKISPEIARFRLVETIGQSCHNCLYRQGGECFKVTVAPHPDYVCDTWVPNPNAG